MKPFTSDDFAAFLVYAGPPPSAGPSPEFGFYNQGKLAARLDYIQKCNDFCQEYFGEEVSYDPRSKVWSGFYTEFKKWFAIRQTMQDEWDSGLDLMTYQVSKGK